MISYWGIDHGDEISKGFKMPRMKKAKVAPAKKSGPQPPEMVRSGEFHYWGKPASKTSAWERTQAKKEGRGGVQYRVPGEKKAPNIFGPDFRNPKYQ